MKKEHVIGLCLMVLIVGIAVVVLVSHPSGSTAYVNTSNESPAAQTQRTSGEIADRVFHNLVPGTSAKTPEDTVLVYKTVPPVVSNETTLEYAKKFNVTGTLKGGAVVQSKDMRYAVEISKKSGRVIYVDQMRPNANQDSPEKLPSDEEAIVIATKFLKDRDLYPTGAAEPVAIRENTYTVGKGDEIYCGEIGVWYHRYLNGLKVEGTQFVVYVGGNGDVIGYFANWRDYEPYKEFPIISSLEASDRLKTTIKINNADTNVSIGNVNLGYKTTAGAYEEDYLEPVWIFNNVMVDGKPVMPVEHYIPALTDNAMKSLSS
jgi:hypothetical protein